MLTQGKISKVTFILLTPGILIAGLTFARAERGTAPTPQVVSGERLTKQQFEALPDNALIEFKGQRATKASIRAREAQNRATAERMNALARQTRAEFEQRRIQFGQQRKAKLEADRAKAMAEFARLNQANSRQIKAIEVEAAQLQERSKRASTAEKARIEERAYQLLQQLRGLEHR